MRDLKYLLAYLMPISAVLALYQLGPWSWASVILAFGILPVLEIFTPMSVENTPDGLEASRARRIFFDVLLYANAPLLFGIVGWYLWVVTHDALTLQEWLGLTLSVGIIIGADGINVAHELGHRSRRAEQCLAQAMLVPALYQHFFIEHNRGHHKNVATLEDPATARFGETVYAFWFRSVFQGWRNAWLLERDRLFKDGKPVWSLRNQMIRFQLIQLLYLAVIAYLTGPFGFVSAVAVGVVGILLLEIVNYIEHYGLQRKLLPTGRPEPVQPYHSWNSDHELGRIFLYELTRHSDHHFKATRKYQILRHLEQSPQMPYGYPTCMLIALLPPLWFHMMNPVVREARNAVGYPV
ncbi:MAG: alkane 1-monooxygenase [Lewinellaceae bacterium]|nr:alkane 1-monooxygenase [Lewinellaceae bacterium]